LKASLSAVFLLAWLAQTSQPPSDVRVSESMFRYTRPIAVERVEGPTSSETPTACAILDATVFAHAAPSLSDLRLFAAGTPPIQVPFALTSSETAPVGDRARVINLGMAGKSISFDLEMPARPYTQVDLDLAGENFLATAKVTGFSELPGPSAKSAQPVALGSYTLFDLTGQNLGRSTSFTLQETRFPFLHIELAVSAPAGHSFSAEPAMVRGAEIPPSREAQTLYTVVAETTTITQRGRETIATFMVPARVPIEQVEFELAPGTKINFSRPVRVRAKLVAPPKPAYDGQIVEPARPEEVSGHISRIRVTEGGHDIRVEDLTIPATIGTNARGAATIEVAIQNGDDQPIPVRAVRLAMRQRKLCFDPPASGATVSLFYGGDKLAPPVYDYVRLFDPTAKTLPAQLSAETANPLFQPPVIVDDRSFTDRHPAVLWAALLAAIAVLGAIAFRSARRVGTS
jgi:hypothetical protein